MNKQSIIQQIAENREAAPLRNFEISTLGDTKKKAKPTPEQQVVIDKMRVRRDLAEDAKNRLNLHYDDEGDLF